MKKARIAELKDHLSRYLDHVKGGGSVLVFDRDQPVAQIVPIQSGRHNTGDLGERLGRLERRGIVRRGAGGLPAWRGRGLLIGPAGLLAQRWHREQADVAS